MLRFHPVPVALHILLLGVLAQFAAHTRAAEEPLPAAEAGNINREKASRLEERLAKISAATVGGEAYMQALEETAKRLDEDRSSWLKLKENIQFALEDESFVPGSQNFSALRAEVANRIGASNRRAASQQAFLDYYIAQQYQRLNTTEASPSIREGDPAQLQQLIQQVNTAEQRLKKLDKTIQEKHNASILHALHWERQYRRQLLQSRGLLINEVIAGNAFALNNLAPITLELNSLTSNVKFYLWGKVAEKIAQSNKKRLLTFSMIRDGFKIIVLGTAITLLIRSRKRLFLRARQWLLRRFQGYKHRNILLAALDLSRELLLFFILLLVGELVIQALVRVGMDFASQLSPVLHWVIIYFLAMGFINFVSPKLSQREKRAAENGEEVFAMETVFKLVPRVYLLYWVIAGVTHQILSQNLHQSLLEFYSTQSLRLLFLGVLLVRIWTNREEWRLVNSKATRSVFWQKLFKQAQGRFWEPAVLLVGGGIGVYRVAWRFLVEQLTEIEMGKRFQAMLSRAMLERQYQKSMRIIDQSWLPELYWQGFSFRTLSAPAWYVQRSDAEQVLQDSLTQWRAEQRGQRILLCGDRGIGKSEIIRHFCAQTSLPTFNAKLTVGCADSTGLCRQLSQSFLQQDISDADDIVAAINRMPPSILCLENLENAMLRKVGGFDGFAFLIDFLLQTSQHHLWLCTCTSFAWTIAKQAVAGSSCFSDLVFIKGMSEQQLQQLVLNRHFANHSQPANFSRLSTAAQSMTKRSNKQVWTDKEQEEKNTELYFRILWDYTRGNPRQALYFWKSSLQWSNGMIEVHLFEVPEQRVLENLTDSTLMLLAALIEHNGLTQEGLAEIMNTSQGNIRRRLEELAPYNMLYRYPENGNPGWHIESFWSRAVENYLEKRQFLFRGHNL